MHFLPGLIEFVDTLSDFFEAAVNFRWKKKIKIILKQNY